MGCIIYNREEEGRKRGWGREGRMRAERKQEETKKEEKKKRRRWSRK